jgi:hypothetical protein
MMLRRTWRTVAANVGVDELLCEFMQGHIPASISRGYVAKLVLSSGSGMRQAQRTVSRRMVVVQFEIDGAGFQFRHRKNPRGLPEGSIANECAASDYAGALSPQRTFPCKQRITKFLAPLPLPRSSSV